MWQYLLNGRWSMKEAAAWTNDSFHVTAWLKLASCVRQMLSCFGWWLFLSCLCSSSILSKSADRHTEAKSESKMEKRRCFWRHFKIKQWQKYRRRFFTSVAIKAIGWNSNWEILKWPLASPAPSDIGISSDTGKHSEHTAVKLLFTIVYLFNNNFITYPKYRPLLLFARRFRIQSG